MIHQLKIEEQYFDDVIRGKKSFEIRLNDRNFSVGDFLGLNELAPSLANDKGEYTETGRCCLVEITYIYADERIVKKGCVILGIRPCAVSTQKDRLFMYGGQERFYNAPIYENEKHL